MPIHRSACWNMLRNSSSTIDKMTIGDQFISNNYSGSRIAGDFQVLSRILLTFLSLLGSSCDAGNVNAGRTDGHIMVFYNVQNLFHPDDDPHTNDNDFTPTGSKGYTFEIYKERIEQVSNVLNSMKSSLQADLLIAGLAEVENEQVLKDLCNANSNAELSYIHKDSPDPRGIDVALIYDPKLFTPDTHFVAGINEPYSPGHNIPRTRDMLFVVGHTDNENFIISVNHWPSRRGGVEKTARKRALAADICRKVIDSLRTVLPEHALVIMGDLNDNPGDESELSIRKNNASDSPSSARLYNPFEELYKKGKGSYVYRNNWNMYDQILVSPELDIVAADVYKDSKLLYSGGSRKGTPKRSFEGNEYVNGYSDHLPVYIIINSISPRNQKP